MLDVDRKKPSQNESRQARRHRQQMHRGQNEVGRGAGDVNLGWRRKREVRITERKSPSPWRRTTPIGRTVFYGLKSSVHLHCDGCVKGIVTTSDTAKLKFGFVRPTITRVLRVHRRQMFHRTLGAKQSIVLMCKLP